MNEARRAGTQVRTAAAVALAAGLLAGSAGAALAHGPVAPARSVLDLTRLPVGDGKYGASAAVGAVYSCTTTYTGGGAFRDGPWFNGDGTYNLTAKAAVDGSVSWSASFSALVSGIKRLLTGNGLPSHATGTYPIARTDDAYSYDRNPNSIREQTLSYEVPSSPTLAAQPTCLGGGAIGVLLSGSPIYNALDEAGRDAVAHEVQDACGGHPQQSGQYHYHGLTPCIDSGDGSDHAPLVGYALDGFGIYGPYGEDGASLSNADLDECHGHTHAIEWEGTTVSMFHYHMTYEFPYTLGCYRGTPTIGAPGGRGAGPGQPGRVAPAGSLPVAPGAGTGQPRPAGPPPAVRPQGQPLGR